MGASLSADEAGDYTMAKGQKKTTREVRKPKKEAVKKPNLSEPSTKNAVKIDIKP
jgi:hypothetical protein